MDLCLQTNQHEIQDFNKDFKPRKKHGTFFKVEKGNNMLPKKMIFYVGCMLFLDLFAWHQPQSIKSAMTQSLKLPNIVFLLA